MKRKRTAIRAVAAKPIPMLGIPAHYALYGAALIILAFMAYKYIKNPALVASQGSVFFLLVVAFLLTFAIREQNSMVEENHIHVIAYDPTDPSSLYIATHYVLERKGAESKEQVGERGDDFMGLVIALDGTFYSSGHLPTGENVGIRKSADKGKTWEILAYEGEDFHNMAISYATSSVVYAWSTPPTEFLTMTHDAGKHWQIVSTPFNRSIFALAADHQNSSILYAGAVSGLYVSFDSGMSWNATSVKGPVVAIADDAINGGVMYVSQQNGVFRSRDDAKTWESFNEGLSNNDIVVFLAVNPHNSDVVALTKHGRVYVSRGDVWEALEGI